ncbi:uncharacterized protein LOC131070484 [Cryptomeria japonica]|uniref:uncharacterized protein LOC131070484 n=1 Tax=Cryptomeria japonica TaxID=3369 RepID=UPI0027D9D138|nr:uncharacterized protein LOC131070484 [Cryptomeria japonica]
MDLDWKIKLVLPILLIPPLFGKGSSMDQVNPRLGVKGEVPEPEWFKVNFDGSSVGNPSQSGIGCILRNSDGICIKEISKKIGVATNNEVEFRAALRGLQLGMELGLQRINLEGDSLNVMSFHQLIWSDYLAGGGAFRLSLSVVVSTDCLLLPADMFLRLTYR